MDDQQFDAALRRIKQSKLYRRGREAFGTESETDFDIWCTCLADLIRDEIETPRLRLVK